MDRVRRLGKGSTRYAMKLLRNEALSPVHSSKQYRARMDAFRLSTAGIISFRMRNCAADVFSCCA